MNPLLDVALYCIARGWSFSRWSHAARSRSPSTAKTAPLSMRRKVAWVVDLPFWRRVSEEKAISHPRCVPVTFDTTTRTKWQH